ncbi:hypothetical protein MXB_826 [Myxobolus squamalis]|nr:hypothetical protein MXB_826 [Myxobolus squamalis]
MERKNVAILARTYQQTITLLYLPPESNLTNMIGIHVMLDELIDKLGGPSHVAEMTGRKSRIVRAGKQIFSYDSRATDDCPLEMINVQERDAFMDGRKYIAIISEAASSGISLQSDRRVNNKRKRLHITLELSWSADRAVQQFGRTHRSNQLSPPEYLFVISELAGEKRFACVVAKRLESLGALTHGDRRATDTRDLSQFNIDNKYGRYALDRMMDVIGGRSKSFCDLPIYEGNFLADSCNVIGKLFNTDSSRTGSDGKEKDNVKIHKFLNRLLGVKVDLQNAIYQFYTNILDHFVKEAKFSGKYDFGIVDLGLGSDVVIEQTKKSYSLLSSSGHTNADLIGFNIERGISYEEAKVRADAAKDNNEGFYMSKEVRGHCRQCMLVLAAGNAKDSQPLFTCSRPNTGFGKKKDSLDNITKNYFKVDPHNIKTDWENFYISTYSLCTHQYFHGTCKIMSKSGDCDVGKRVKTIYLLCGAIFSLWAVIETTFGSSPIRMARITTRENVRRIGIMIPKPFVARLMSRLEYPK